MIYKSIPPALSVTLGVLAFVWSSSPQKTLAASSNLPKADCVMSVRAGVPLIVGAVSQRIPVQVSSNCLKERGLTIPPPKTLGSISSIAVQLKPRALRDAGVLDGELLLSADSSESQILRLNNVPKTFPRGIYEFEVLNGEGVISHIALTLDEIQVRNELQVSYADSILNRQQSGQSSENAERKPIAVVNPTVQLGAIRNEASIHVPATLSPSSSLGHYWVVADTSWGRDISIRDCTPLYGDQIYEPTFDPREQISWSPGGCWLSTVGQIGFEAHQAHSNALLIRLQLVSVPRATSMPEEAQLVIELEVAGESRLESMPLPISDAIFLSCANDRASEVRSKSVDSISDSSIREGRCSVVLRANKLQKQIKDHLLIYGPQVLTVSVHREGSDDRAELQWNVDLKASQDESATLTLPAPKDDSRATGAYVIDVRVEAQSPRAVYRRGASLATSSTVDRISANFLFQARLRSRGLFGWPRGNGRAFVTVPVDVAALRFPSVTRDLLSSDQSRYAQLTLLRIGILGVVEPWNYTTGSNWLPIPARVSTGFNLFSLSSQGQQPVFTPEFMAGISVTLPLMDSLPQLGTSLALGVFYALDLRDTRSYCLLTLGFNVLSLLGPSK